MAVMGPIAEGLYGDHSVLLAKSVFDFVIIMMLPVIIIGVVIALI